MQTPTPFTTYYRACVGRWRGTYYLEVSSWSALFRAPMGAADRLRVLGGVLMSWVLGPPVMETSLTWPWKGDERQAMHTTRLQRFGATLAQSEELFVLKADADAAFNVRGDMRFAPALQRPGKGYGGSNGEVRIHARGALYHFDLLGEMLDQRTAMLDEGELAVVQVNSWSRGTVILRRYETVP